MGHRHTPEKLSECRGLRCADGGSVADAQGPVNASRQLNQENRATETRPVAPLRPDACAANTFGVRFALLALNFYKANLSILFAGNCRYQPTCSRYAYEAIERFGVAGGMWLAVKRLLRCHPLSGKFGYDPVPEKWEEMRTDSAMNVETREVGS
jgi:putative membrane protein insertion efficiency factor